MPPPDDSSRDNFMIRLQFPTGRAEIVPVSPSTTVEELHIRHVDHMIPPGRLGQLFCMGRALSPPSSTLSSHGVVADTVVQVFIRQPVPVNADGEPLGVAAETLGRPMNPHLFAGLCGGLLASGWLYFFLIAENSADEEIWEDLHLVALFGLLFLSMIFVMSGGLRNLTNLVLR